jgi:hypothetical protein
MRDGSTCDTTGPDCAAHGFSSRRRPAASRLRRCGDFSKPLIDAPLFPPGSGLLVTRPESNPRIGSSLGRRALSTP